MQVDVDPVFKRLDDDAHIRSRVESAVPICLDRHNFATDRCSLRYRLPKSWANVGAFSLLTPRSKLAQY